MAKKAAKTKKKTKAAAKKKTATKKTAKAKTTKAKKATKKTADEGDEAVKKKKAKKKTKRKSRAKKDEDIRQRVYWGVYNHAMKLVFKFAFNQKKAAQKKARELSPEGKPPHFVQKLKEPIEEE